MPCVPTYRSAALKVYFIPRAFSPSLSVCDPRRVTQFGERANGHVKQEVRSGPFVSET